ncbi:hypothetical protein PGT21_002470 [Puccinia graminis f. sp. tritici]|uniref:Secreted protein n=1 Tax=Puccinia graminis f. sp. tritici TaxID=56615 RepID=A0A5B0SB01_PUCGR|nr:hypothetical protein PGT21_002470 [Puccinia graminis f. sp. tritici]KAA1134699.1 hypothetical protein PGTUg99_005651 [Puccinia graminis f. sp. tritici]
MWPTSMPINSLFLLSLVIVLCLDTASANWDEATGYLHDYKPSDTWLRRNQPKRCSKNIQIAECAHNTRLSYPDVQLMAVFTVNHADDRYHGCPYGTCCGYTQLPAVNEMEPDPGNSHCFFRYELAGFPGIGTNPIANPQTGRYGYETSIDGQFHEGPVDLRSRQPNHDRHYPGFRLPKAWSKPLPFPKQPNVQPACAVKGQPNSDPGQDGGKKEYGHGLDHGDGNYHDHRHHAGNGNRGGSPESLMTLCSDEY